MKKIISLILALLLISASLCAMADEAAKELPVFSFGVSTYHDNRSKDMTHYRLFTPAVDEGKKDALGVTIAGSEAADDKKYPLVVYLHDVDGCGVDNKAQMNDTVYFLAGEQVQKEHPCYVVAPQMNSWWDGIGVNTVVKDLLAKYENIDVNRVYVIGEYLGGWGAYEAVLHGLNIYAAAIAGAPEVQKQLEYEHKTFVITDDTWYQDMCKKLVATSFWILQPKGDERVPEEVNKAFFDTMSNYKRELDGQTYTINAKYSLLDVTPDQAVMENADGIIDWLFEQKRTLNVDIADFVDKNEQGIMRTNHIVTYSPVP